MKTLLLEIRDRSTFIPVMATEFKGGESPLLRVAGYAADEHYVIVTKLTGGEVSAEYDPFDWPGHSRTMMEAHKFIRQHFDKLSDGDVVDCEFILGESKEPKKSDMEPSKPNPQRESINGLRGMADFLEQHELDTTIETTVGLTLNVFVDSQEELARLTKIVGSCHKQAAGDWFYISKKFSETVRLEINCKRELVCERVSKGFVTVAAKPAEPEREVEVFEWSCPESILGGKDK